MELEQAKRDYDEDMSTADARIAYVQSSFKILGTRLIIIIGESFLYWLTRIQLCREARIHLKELVAASKRLQENQRLLDLQTADRVAAAAAAARSQLHAIARDVKSSTAKLSSPNATTQLPQNERNSNATKETIKAAANTTRSKFIDFIIMSSCFRISSTVFSPKFCCWFRLESCCCAFCWRYGVCAQAWSECEGR